MGLTANYALKCYYSPLCKIWGITNMSASSTSWNACQYVIRQQNLGWGRLAVFALSSFHQVDPVAAKVATLVLCQTVGAPYQICHEFDSFIEYLPEIKVAIYVGVHIRKHKGLLKSECAHILVVALGRIIAPDRYKDLSLKNAGYFIHDACGRMHESLDVVEASWGSSKHLTISRS